MSATELQTPRRGFTVKARARPALASLSAGFTRSDLALAPMPAIGQLAGKGKEPEKKKMTFGEVMQLASKRAFRGGAAGFIAGVVQVRAFPSPPGARLTTARKTTAVTFSMNDTPSAVDAVDRRARPRRVSVSFAMALATEGHAVCRDATSRRALRSRGRANNPELETDGRAPHRGTPGEPPRAPMERTGHEPSFWFFSRTDGLLANLTPFSAPFCLARARAHRPPLARDPRHLSERRTSLFLSSQVGSFMWLRTTMNYQYANGGTLTNALSTLYKEGGVPRFYRGVSFAIIQNPLSRFGDTAANTGVMVALGELAPNMPVATQTAFASLGGATWRIMLTPVDTFKTTLQVQGAAALSLLKDKVKAGGVGVLYGGAAANFAANWVGNYPWFVTFNYLQANVPKYDGVKGLARNAVIGMCASFVSDCVSNSLRVVKTIKQTNADANLGYIGAVKGVLKTDGVAGLFGRGLKTRLITNIAQSMVFSVAWKAIEQKLNENADKKAAAKGKGGKTGSMTLATLPALNGGCPPLKHA